MEFHRFSRFKCICFWKYMTCEYYMVMAKYINTVFFMVYSVIIKSKVVAIKNCSKYKPLCYSKTSMPLVQD